MKANEYMSQLKAAFPKADAIYEDTIIDICGRGRASFFKGKPPD